MSHFYPLTRLAKGQKPPEIEALDNIKAYLKLENLEELLHFVEIDRAMHEDDDKTTQGLLWEGRTPPECPPELWINYHYHLKIKTDMLRDREMCLNRCNTKTRLVKHQNGQTYGVVELAEGQKNTYQEKYAAKVRMLDHLLQIKESELAPWRHMINQYRQRSWIKALLGQRPVPEMGAASIAMDPKMLQRLATAGAVAGSDNNGKKSKPVKRGRGKPPKPLFMKTEPGTRIEEPPQTSEADGISEQENREEATGEP